MTATTQQPLSPLNDYELFRDALDEAEDFAFPDFGRLALYDPIPTRLRDEFLEIQRSIALDPGCNPVCAFATDDSVVRICPYRCGAVYAGPECMCPDGDSDCLAGRFAAQNFVPFGKVTWDERDAFYDLPAPGKHFTGPFSATADGYWQFAVRIVTLMRCSYYHGNGGINVHFGPEVDGFHVFRIGPNGYGSNLVFHVPASRDGDRMVPFEFVVPPREDLFSLQEDLLRSPQVVPVPLGSLILVNLMETTCLPRSNPAASWHQACVVDISFDSVWVKVRPVGPRQRLPRVRHRSVVNDVRVIRLVFHC